MRLFLISGKAGSGKNEVAQIIKDNLPKTVISSLSKYIKLFAIEMTTWNFNDEDNKPRTFLQTMGDELRNIDENFLTKRLYEDIKLYEKYYDNLVLSDVRLINEILYFKSKVELDVITIRINSSESKRELSNTEKVHLTETELDNYNFDYVIENDFNNTLNEKVVNILKGLK